MSKLSLAEQQQKTKPKIEDVIVEILDGERQQNALNFVAYLREQKLNPRWTATNAWGIKYKGKNLINIRVSKEGSNCYKLAPISWHIGGWYIDEWLLNNVENFKDLVECDEFKELVWANLNYCNGCAKCKPGTNKSLFGKDFDSLCYGFFLLDNPDINTLEWAKKLLEYKKKGIAENGEKRGL